MNDAEALTFAKTHIATWNSHDLEAIAALYSDGVELTSPVAAALTGDPMVRGRRALRAYAALGLQRYPDLTFELIDVFVCVSSLTLLFRGAGGREVAEVLFVNAQHEVERVFAHYKVAPNGAGAQYRQ